MRAEPARLFITTGMVQRACMRGYWMVFATWIAIDLQLSPVQLVVLGTAMEATVLVSEIPTGVVADVISRRLSVIVAFGLMGGGMMLAGATETYWVLVASQMLWGFGWTFQSGAETAWVTDELGGAGEAESLILRRARLQFVMSIVGAAVGAALGALVSLPFAVVTFGAITFGWAVVLSLVMSEHGFVRTRGDTWSQFATTLRAGAQRTRGTPALRLVAAVVVLGAFGGEVMDRLDIRRLDQVGLPDNVPEVVIVSVLATMLSITGYVLLGLVERRAVGSQLTTAAAVLWFVAAGGTALVALVAVLPIAAIGLIVQGGMRSSMAPIYIAWVNAHTPARTRATVHSFVGQADAAGEISGGLILAWVASTTTVPTAMACSGALFVLAGAFATRGRRSWAPGDTEVVAEGNRP